MWGSPQVGGPWCVQRTERKPVWLEQTGEGKRVEGEEVRGSRHHGGSFRLGNKLGWEAIGGI